MKGLSRLAMIAALTVLLLTANDALAQTLDAPARQLARDVFQQLIETDTTHSTGSTTAAAEAMRARLLGAGFPAADLQIAGSNPKRMNLVARYRSAAGSTLKPVLIIGHLDVVEARRADWTRDPFKLTETAGYFYGRGTQDMKDSDASFVTSFLLLKKSGFVPRRDLILALTADEEGGADNGVDWLLKNRRELVDAAFVINPDAGGLELRNGKPVELQVEAAEKLYADFEVSATNPGGHSSLPVPQNAIYAVTNALNRLEHSPFEPELNEVTRAYLAHEARTMQPERAALAARVLATPIDRAAAALLSRDPRLNALLHTTCVATMISGGHAVNALPGSATANVNCRILPGHPPEEVRRRLVSLFTDGRGAGFGVTVQYKDNAGKLSATAPTEAAPKPPPMQDAVMQPVRKIVAAMFPGIPVVPTQESGASDSIYTMAAGMPSYGFSAMGIEHGDDRAHGRDERLGVESIYTGVAFTRELLLQIGSE